MNVRPSQLDSKSWLNYLQHGQRMFYKAKTPIYHQGQLGDGFYFLYRGLIKVVMEVSPGQQRMLDIRCPGQIFGEQAIDKQPYFSTALTAEDSVVYHFPFDTFKQLIQDEPDILILFLNSTVNKMRLLSDKILLKSLPAEQRIAYVLLRIAYLTRQRKIALSQKELSEFTGLTRITVYNTFKKWREMGWVESNKRTIILLRPELLESAHPCLPSQTDYIESSL